MIAYSVSQRTREIGIRMALGAPPASVHKLILGQAMRPVLASLAAGLLASLVAMRALASLLYGVTATDPPTFLVVAGVLLAISALASALPARRAAHVDPMAALRHESRDHNLSLWGRTPVLRRVCRAAAAALTWAAWPMPRATS